MFWTKNRRSDGTGRPRSGQFRYVLFGVPAVVLVALLVSNCVTAQERSAFDDVTGDIAGAIVKASRGSPTPVDAAVADFTQKNGLTTSLGVKLADEFSASLAKQAKGFGVIDRVRLESISPDDLLDPNAVKCGETRPITPVIILGNLEEFPDHLILWIRGQEFHAPIFERRIEIPLTEEMRALSSQVRRDPEALVWVSADHPPVPNVEPEKAGTKGYTYPSCIRCTVAQYSDPASLAKIQGSVTLDVVISADGFPAKITVVHGLPCGLSQSAMEAVRQWRFQPAMGLDGKPVEVLQQVEVTFHLY